MGFILSCTTTPKRIDYLIKLIPKMKIRYKYFVINICNDYKRFGKFQIPRSLLQLCKNNKKVVFNFVEDYGAVCKYLGGFAFMKKKRLYDDKLIIIDDDIFYDKDLFYDLLDNKSKNNITTGSGFNYGKNFSYEKSYGACEMIEGYGGVCFDYEQMDEFILYYANYYKCIESFDSDDLIQKYLSASFLGDDFIISYCYKDKWAVENSTNHINPQQYGFQSDALHKNNVFGSNMDSYYFLYKNIEILKTFQRKMKLNNQIKNKIKNKKILFCSLSDRPEFSEKIFIHNKKYFKKHNYKFVIEKKSLCNDRHAAWSKLLLVQREMKKNPSYDYVVWIDDDILIMNKEKPFEDFINENPFENILICRDCKIARWVFNSGLFVCKNNKTCRDILEDVYINADPKYFFNPVWEQDALCDYYLKNPDPKIIKIIPHRTMQSINEEYKPGDFSIHLAGLPLEQRMKIRDIILKKYN